MLFFSGVVIDLKIGQITLKLFDDGSRYPSSGKAKASQFRHSPDVNNRSVCNRRFRENQPLDIRKNGQLFRIGVGEFFRRRSAYPGKSLIKLYFDDIAAIVFTKNPTKPLGSRRIRGGIVVAVSVEKMPKIVIDVTATSQFQAFVIRTSSFVID